MMHAHPFMFVSCSTRVNMKGVIWHGGCFVVAHRQAPKRAKALQISKLGTASNDSSHPVEGNHEPKAVLNKKKIDDILAIQKKSKYDVDEDPNQPGREPARKPKVQFKNPFKRR